MTAESEMRRALRKQQREGKRIILCGDGQYDSPGTCAQLCAYALAMVGVEDVRDNGDVHFQASG